MIRRSLLLAAVSALFLVGAGAALAVPPEHHTDSEDYNGSASCGTFSDVYVGHLEVSAITTFDRAGNPVRDVVHIRGWETNSRSDDPSVSITAKRNWTIVYDYASETEMNAGAVFTQTAPGQGVLFHDVGNVRFGAGGGDVTVHGPHDILDQGDAAFCNALLAVS